jgi:hypothetical protein
MLQSRGDEPWGAVTQKLTFLTRVSQVSDLPTWDDLSQALERVTAATRDPEDRAKTSICRAICARVIRLLCKLKEDKYGVITSDSVLEGKDFHIPDEIKPEDLDWKNSRPLKLWTIRTAGLRERGDWYLEWIKLCSADVAGQLCRLGRQGKATQAASSQTDAARRRSPALESASQAIRELYRGDVPTQDKERNAVLFRRVGKWLSEKGLPDVSDTTILRAAGRRK